MTTHAQAVELLRDALTLIRNSRDFSRLIGSSRAIITEALAATASIEAPTSEPVARANENDLAKINDAVEIGVASRRRHDLHVPLYAAPVSQEAPKIRLLYERPNFWHVGCATGHHAKPCKVISHATESSIIECAACGKRGSYPVGAVGERCVDESPPASTEPAPNHINDVVEMAEPAAQGAPDLRQKLRNEYQSGTAVSDFHGPKITLRYRSTAAAEVAFEALTDLIDGRVAPGSAEDEEDEEDDALIQTLGNLLAGVATALKGPEPARTRWSYHDLPELAGVMALELEFYKAGIVGKDGNLAAPTSSEGGATIADRAAQLIADATAAEQVVTITLAPHWPPAMGAYTMVSDVRLARHAAAPRESAQ